MIQHRFDELRLTGALPSPSAIGLRVLEITQNDDYDQAELVQTVMADPALSGRVIQLANSAIHAGQATVETVREAALRLGSKTLRSLALGFSLVGQDEGNRGGLDHHTFWSRSLATAVAASTLSFERRIFAPAEAFTCGLLAGIGQLAFASLYPERYERFMGWDVCFHDARLAKLESCAFGMNHAEVASLMMEDWGFPKSSQQAILRSIEKPIGDMPEGSNSGSEGLARILRAGRAIADVLTIDRDRGNELWVTAFFRLEGVAKELDMSVAELHAIADQIVPAWQEWGQLLGVPSGQPVAFVCTAEEFARLGVTASPRQLAWDAPGGSPGDVNSSEDEDPKPLEVVSNLKVCEAQRVLLIDDEETMVRLLSHYLMKAGFEVESASSSKEGLRKAISWAPHIVVTDWMMPGMTGVELCRALRETPVGQRMYVLLVTAHDDDAQILEAFDAGADDYIVKPFNPSILVARVRAGQRTVRMRQEVENAKRIQQRQLADMGILTRKLEQAALTDVLTELPNRRYGMQRLQQEWEGCQRTGNTLSVVMADIDFFKRINDKHGHDAGDAVLRQCADILRQNCRQGDVLARLGGEEFIIIHLNAGVSEVVASTERLRIAVEDAVFVHLGASLKMTMSFGVAEKIIQNDSIDDLMRAADGALYEAKESGRNAIVAFRPPGLNPDQRAAG
ncbi:MAG: diguanylate cyclase [bacterium]|nr:diguanylate cyclase [bacterium]